MTAPDKIWSNGQTNGALGDCWMECATEEMPGREVSYTRTDLIPALLAEARAEGIRDAAKICIANRDVSGWVSRDAILALIDTPAPAPAQPSVQEAALVLAGAMERREWSYYPIEMPVSSDGNGPATVGVDATSITYEVWEAATLKAISSHEKLPDAVAAALRALAGETKP